VLQHLSNADIAAALAKISAYRICRYHRARACRRAVQAEYRQAQRRGNYGCLYRAVSFSPNHRSRSRPVSQDVPVRSACALLV
jgi:hypothetical protein